MKRIEFERFAVYFIYLLAEIELTRFSKNNTTSKKSLNQNEFVIVLCNSFSLVKLSLFNKKILHKIFQKIDTDHDALITY